MTKQRRKQLEQDWSARPIHPFASLQEPELPRPHKSKTDHMNGAEKIAYAKRNEIITRIEGGAKAQDLASGFGVAKEFIIWLVNRAKV